LDCRGQKRVFADSYFSAKDNVVVDLDFRMLGVVCKPLNDVVVVFRVNLLDVIDPSPGLRRIAMLDGWRPIQIEATGTRMIKPAAVLDQSAVD
jgi:hypothetical protein